MERTSPPHLKHPFRPQNSSVFCIGVLQNRYQAVLKTHSKQCNRTIGQVVAALWRAICC